MSAVPIAAAYQELLGRADPATEWLLAGATDGRWTTVPEVDRVVVRGSSDLIELRQIVERITGPGSWPAPTTFDGESRRQTIDIERPAQLMRLVVALDGEVRDNSSMWRTWKTTVEAIAVAVADLRRVTVESVLTTTQR